MAAKGSQVCSESFYHKDSLGEAALCKLSVKQSFASPRQRTYSNSVINYKQDLPHLLFRYTPYCHIEIIVLMRPPAATLP